MSGIDILLTRHAKSFANARDLAFGNIESPLSPEGVDTIPELRQRFEYVHGIIPELYERAVAASIYTRTQETGQKTGFKKIEVQPILNEAYIAPNMLARGKIVQKHANEGWVPDELQDRADEFLQLVRDGEFDYEVCMTHGFFVAAVKMKIANEHEIRGEKSPFVFDPKRGHIPDLATISKVTI